VQSIKELSSAAGWYAGRGCALIKQLANCELVKHDVQLQLQVSRRTMLNERPVFTIVAQYKAAAFSQQETKIAYSKYQHSSKLFSLSRKDKRRVLVPEDLQDSWVLDTETNGRRMGLSPSKGDYDHVFSLSYLLACLLAFFLTCNGLAEFNACSCNYCFSMVE